MMKKIQALLIAASMAVTGAAMADHQGMGEHCKMHTKVTFEQADKDKDGTLDREEAKAVCGEKFDVMDTDKDGTLTKKEVNACGRKPYSENDQQHQKRSK
jgi:Ca2+-binding EF-hand superfamily protein